MATPTLSSRNSYYSSANGPLSSSQFTSSPFRCDLCSRDFVHETALQNHMRTSKAHQRTKPRSSQRNPQTAQTNGPQRYPPTRPNAHVGPQTSTPTFECSACNRKFVNGGALAMHIKYSKAHRKGKSVETGTIAGASQETAAPKGNVPTRTFEASPPTFTFGVIEPIFPETLRQQEAPIVTSSQPNGSSNNRRVNPVNGSPWSRLPEHEWLENLGSLARQCHSLDILSKNGYRIREFTDDDMDKLLQQGKIESGGRTDCIFHPWKPSPEMKRTGDNTKNKEPLVYHCCGETGRGCVVSTVHEYSPLDPLTRSRLRSYARTPRDPQLGTRKSAAIALDCEMVGVVGGIGAVIRLCAVDYISGATLIDTLVNPIERIVQWRTKYSGVTRPMLADARARGRALSGWKEARAELWKYIDANTILIGQSLNNDLSALRMVHTRVVDSAILTKNAVGPDCHRSWGLKTLSEDFLNLKIQNQKSGHDCMEDTLATREVVLECNRNPLKLRAWAHKEREIILEEKEKREQEKQAREKEKREANAQAKIQVDMSQQLYVGSDIQSLTG